MRPSRTSAGRATRAPNRQGGFDAADLAICENLYAQSGAVTPPFFAYTHGVQISPTENCPTGSGSAISGLAFAPTTGGAYPASYAGALFFADYARNCIWTMTPDAGGVPNPATVTVFMQEASFPVDLRFGPDGRLYYVDVGVDGVGEGRSGGSTISPAISRRSPSQRQARRAVRHR